MRRLLLLIVVLYGCRQPASRLLHVRVAADPAFRQRSGWREIITGRVRAVSLPGVRLELAGIEEWLPPAEQTVEQERRLLAGSRGEGNWIDLGIVESTGDGRGEPGLAVPFDPRLLVFDSPGQSESANTANLTHLLGHVFGAWDSPDPTSVMHLPPGKSWDSNAGGTLRLTGSIDLRQGIAGLDEKSRDRLQQLWASAHAPNDSNPLYRAYDAQGMELLDAGQRPLAVEALERAVRYGPKVAQAHAHLATAELGSRQISSALAEFRQAAAIDPQSSRALSGLAAALLASGQANEAISVLENAIVANPGDAALHANLGTVLVHAPGRIDEGIANLREAVRLDPALGSARRSLEAALESKAKGRK
jgi:Tfp pilus assembly protein PilF